MAFRRKKLSNTSFDICMIQAYNFVGLCHLDLAFTLSSWNMVSNNVMTLTLSLLVKDSFFFQVGTAYLFGMIC